MIKALAFQFIDTFNDTNRVFEKNWEPYAHSYIKSDDIKLFWKLENVIFTTMIISNGWVKAKEQISSIKKLPLIISKF